MMTNNQDRLTSIGLRLSTKCLLDGFKVGDESYNSAIKRLVAGRKENGE